MGRKWKEKQMEVFGFKAILSSRSNIFVHGANGSGKTSFVTDCITTLREEEQPTQELYVYVDCIEHFSEKLIAVTISQQLRH